MDQFSPATSAFCLYKRAMESYILATGVYERASCYLQYVLQPYPGRAFLLVLDVDPQYMHPCIIIFSKHSPEHRIRMTCRKYLFSACAPSQTWAGRNRHSAAAVTRKLSYRKDDRAMRPIYECPEKFLESLTTPTTTFPNLYDHNPPTSQTDRQKDDMQSQYRALHYSASRGKMQ